MVTIVNCHRIDCRFDPACSSAPPNRPRLIGDWGPSRFCNYFITLPSSIFTYQAASDIMCTRPYRKKCAQPPAAVRPTTARARSEAASPPSSLPEPPLHLSGARAVGFELGTSGAGVQGASTKAHVTAPFPGHSNHTVRTTKYSSA